MTRAIRNPENGAWPKLSHLIDAEVMSVRMRSGQRALLLEFAGDEKVQIPVPWMFTSCLLAVASTELVDSEREHDDNVAELIGLAGARLTAVE
ncbi:MAG: hypothetical protein ACI8UO_005327 [Verrucomicrobiales bacterium]|jgi:hypothetical protein